MNQRNRNSSQSGPRGRREIPSRPGAIPSGGKTFSSSPPHQRHIPRHKHSRHPKRRHLFFPLIAGFITLLFIFATLFVLRTGRSAPEPILEEDWVTQDLLTVNEYSRPGIALSEVSHIVVHYVGNPGTTAQQNRNYFESLATTGATHASSHFVIGTDGTIIQCIPTDEMAYASNARNADSISIECCHPDADGAFTQETYRALIRLLRQLCRSYRLDRDDIIRHYDVTGKECPLYYVNHEDAWLQLKSDVFDKNYIVD